MNPCRHTAASRSRRWLNMHDKLINDGYCVVPNVLDQKLLEELRHITDNLLAQMSPEEARRQRSTGSMIPVVRDHRLVPLIAHRAAIRAIETLGFHDVR